MFVSMSLKLRIRIYSVPDIDTVYLLIYQNVYIYEYVYTHTYIFTHSYIYLYSVLPLNNYGPRFSFIFF